MSALASFKIFGKVFKQKPYIIVIIYNKTVITELKEQERNCKKNKYFIGEYLMWSGYVHSTVF